MDSGEVGRYVGKYDTARISKAVFAAPLEPFLPKTSDNSTGLGQSVFDGIVEAAGRDRFVHYVDFTHNFHDSEVFLGSEHLREHAFRHSLEDAFASSAYGTRESIKSRASDFRQDITKIDVPALIVHDTEDRTLPSPPPGGPSTPPSPTPSTSRSTARRTECCGPTPRKSTRSCSNSSTADSP